MMKVVVQYKDGTSEIVNGVAEINRTPYAYEFKILDERTSNYIDYSIDAILIYMIGVYDE